jgi:hypothetical protein
MPAGATTALGVTGSSQGQAVGEGAIAEESKTKDDPKNADKSDTAAKNKKKKKKSKKGGNGKNGKDDDNDDDIALPAQASNRAFSHISIGAPKQAEALNLKPTELWDRVREIAKKRYEFELPTKIDQVVLLKKPFNKYAILR